MKDRIVTKKNQNRSWVQSNLSYVFSTSIFFSIVLFSGCTSKQNVIPKKKPRAVHGEIIKANDYSKECSWKFFARETKKKCVRK